jgi:glutamate N-acetyltransferase/amino-acid N-acetyltransferase
MTPGPGIARTPLPKGFTASGINSGVRKYRPDLGIIISETEAVAAGVFTLNNCKSAPVLYSQGILPSDHIYAIVTNSGQANAATGPEGRERNWQMALAASRAVGCLPHQILTASTGVIGVPLEIEKIEAAMPELVDRAGDTAEPFAVAILTTDLVPKTVSADVVLSGGTVKITGVAKGSGMIHPNMATMLGYLLSDVKMSAKLASELLTDSVNLSFNMISVDGDTSTNDCVFLMANGASQVELTSVEDIALFKEALIEISIFLAKSIARDGEGATKLIEVNLAGAPNHAMARQAARGLTLSPLIKSAVHGEDPNWGRILAKLGAESIPADCLEKMTLTVQGTTLFENGKPTLFDRSEVRRLLKTNTVLIHADFRSGMHDARAWGCDLSKKYVEINAEYTT